MDRSESKQKSEAISTAEAQNIETSGKMEALGEEERKWVQEVGESKIMRSW